MRTKPHRLPGDRYVGRLIVAITLCEADRRPCLATPEIFTIFRPRLESVCAKFDCTSPLFTLMPDHTHLLLFGQTGDARPLDAVTRLKIDTARDFSMMPNRPRWQKGFYDHIVRGDWEKHARYVCLNPVRSGLCVTGDAWPFTGSVGYDPREILLDAFWQLLLPVVAGGLVPTREPTAM